MTNHKKVITLLGTLFITVSLYAKGNKLKPDTLSIGNFGKVYIYKPAASPTSVALFISGDGGWNSGVIDMAKELLGLNALVIGVDIKTYLKKINTSKSKCIYPAADFEELSQSVQKKLGMKTYINPVLVGYSSGATLVYATLVQAPARTFAGGISLGFCPDLEIKKDLCKGNGLKFTPVKKPQGLLIEPFPQLTASWTVLHGLKDKVCDASICDSFTKKIPNAHFISLPDVGHGFSSKIKWVTQFKTAYQNTLIDFEKRVIKVAAHKKTTTKNSPGDLPITLTEVEKYNASKPMAIIISGDGGWTDFDQNIADELAKKDIPSVGLSSLKYFWERKSPTESSADLLRLITYYSVEFKHEKVFLIGYSYGADVMPFMASRLPPEVNNNIQCIALLSPSATVDFEFHVSSWFNSTEDNSIATKPEIEKLDSKKLLIVNGSDENNDVIKTLRPTDARFLTVPGGHHYNDNIDKVIEAIISYDK